MIVNHNLTYSNYWRDETIFDLGNILNLGFYICYVSYISWQILISVVSISWGGCIGVIVGGGNSASSVKCKV